MGKEKAERKKSLYEQVFGNTLESTKETEGISKVKIVDSYHIGHIPGLIEHWKQDIEHRKVEILQLKKRSFFKIFSVLWSDNQTFEKASGKELYHLHSTKATKALVKKLIEDPTDTMARLQLVSLVGRSGRDFSLENYRSLFLQAMVACSFNELHLKGMGIALWTQEVYFSKLLGKCKVDLAKIEGMLTPSQTHPNNVYAKQHKILKERMQSVKSNIALIQAYLHYTSMGLRSLQITPPMALSLEEIKQGGKPAIRQSVGGQQQLWKKAYRVLSILRYLPLLHTEVHPFAEALRTMDSQRSLPDLIEARVYRSQLTLSIYQYQSGYRESDVIPLIQERFNKAYRSYNSGFQKVGEVATHPEENTILIEYADLIYDFFRFSQNKIDLPAEWLQHAFNKALKALRIAKPSPETETLIACIQQAMAEEELQQRVA